MKKRHNVAKKQRKSRAKWIPVKSSAMTAIRYRAAGKKLDVMWNGDTPHEYTNVPQSKFLAALEAESKGKFVNQVIKPNYRQRKLPPNEV